MGIVDSLSSGTFLLAAELHPPKGVNLDALLALAGKLKGRVDFLEIADNPEAVMRASALATAAKLHGQGPPVALRTSCRDRNRLSLQGDLLGAQMLGLQAVIIEAGRDPAFGDHPNARHAQDLDLLGLAGAAKALSSGKDLAGLDLDGAFDLPVGAEIDFWAAEGEALDKARNQARELAGQGVRFFRTSPVYDAEAFSVRLDEFADLGLPVIASVSLLKSGGMANYINRNLQGDKVPRDAIKRLQKAPDKREAAVAIAAETTVALKTRCAGVCLQPLGWDDLLPAVAAAIGR